jgi:Putative protein-S-isoprenylcysteine methyltransferase
MNPNTQTSRRIKIDKSGINYIIRLCFQLLFMILSFFIAAGNVFIARVWIYFGIAAAVYLISSIILIKCNPELMNERAKARDNTKAWDKLLLGLYIFIAFFGIHIVAGLDVGRFKWSCMDVSYFVPGLVLYILSSVFGGWAMIVNKYFEATVRIQDDREHKVIKEGPYKIVRHPGYMSILLGITGVPLMIGSLYAFICSAAVIVIIVIRTALEDKMLQRELRGYSDYSRQVKYRLILFIW